MDNNNLQRFLQAQHRDYPTALAEIKQSRKRSHWMWYVFPQIAGLGFSETSRHYAIKDINEAQAYLYHQVLGERLIEICNELLKLPDNNATHIFGTPDDMKLRSCVTLFASLPGANPVFRQVLDKFFNGEGDQLTINLLLK